MENIKLLATWVTYNGQTWHLVTPEEPTEFKISVKYSLIYKLYMFKFQSVHYSFNTLENAQSKAEELVLNRILEQITIK